jgi:hypothetical protein
MPKNLCNAMDRPSFIAPVAEKNRTKIVVSRDAFQQLSGVSGKT